MTWVSKGHITPGRTLPCKEAHRIYREVVKSEGSVTELPKSEPEFRATLNPLDIVKNRATAGGPQPAEMTRMLALARQRAAEQAQWIRSTGERIENTLNFRLRATRVAGAAPYVPFLSREQVGV